MGRDLYTTVDVAVSELVIQAATTRIKMVRQLERKQHGRSSLNLSTLAEQILRQWTPEQTRPLPPPPDDQAECPTCGKRVKLYHNGKLRAHKNEGVKCPEAFASQAAAAAGTVKPLRFPMNRADYKRIAAEIHAANQSVANVISQRLKEFATKGEL